MSLKPYLCAKTAISRRLQDSGAFRVGFARAAEIDAAAAAEYTSWVARGCHGTMDYLARHEPLRRHPQAVLPGVRTVIVAAFPYAPPAGVGHPGIADYALGEDYHRVVRRRLDGVAAYIRGQFGALTRVCCDSAPLPERYWAVKAGVGFTGLNHQLYIPGAGAGFFLGEILTSLELQPDAPVENECSGCGLCVRSCPTGALKADGCIDAGRCLSYLTVEHRGELPPGADLHGRIAGCDTCRRVCPLTAAATPPSALPEFTPRPELLALSRADIATLTTGAYRRLTAHSALSRIPLSRLRKNASAKRFF